MRDADTRSKTYQKFATDAEADIYRDLVEQAFGRRPETLYEEPGHPSRPAGHLPCTITRWAEFGISGLSGTRVRQAGLGRRQRENGELRVRRGGS